jgi:RNA polymerase sigma-70 factor (ECF subfamily)
VSNLYGLCHELGHVAMYGLLADRDWLSGGGGAEGWAHFAGSVVVDEVYRAKGERLWPDPYDYRADGSARLARQRKEPKPDDVVPGAGQWQDLEAIIGRKAFPALFKEWQATKIDAAKPDAVFEVLVRLHPAKKDALATWWKAARPVLVEPRQGSAFSKAELPPDRLTGRPVLLKEDDGRPDGKRSIAGGGHARAFAAPAAGEWYLRSVSVFGARYGPTKAPATDFDIVLCDKDLRPIATWKKPYAAFPRGEAAWVKLDVPPTRVPKDFAVCVVFRPTATSGVFVSSDSSTSGHSFSSVPGKEAVALEKGDWMIRAEIDQPKAADALNGH